ncbi:MAG TPA: Ppx/GppA phosphatase family protein [Bacteroidota bacterium]|nr:Ppx/GppA phosphatase family protein [Bacteroidota bacterium]
MRNATFPLAAIDIGTNSLHLIVADVDPSTGRFKVIDREKIIVRLGSDSADMRYLSEAAMNRAITTLKHFRTIADGAHAPIVAIATSAVREAINQEEFIYRVKAETDIDVQIASDVEEARLIYLGVLQALPVFDSRILLIDIGGGSTEFLVGRRREISYNTSLKLGAVRLTQRFFQNEEKLPKSIRECREFIHGTMSPVTRRLKNMNVELVVGTSGTINTLANVIRLGSKRPASALNNFSFTDKNLASAVRKILAAKNFKARKRIKGIDNSRADIILAGTLILDEIFSELKIKKMVVSDFALREGILYDTLEKSHTHSATARWDNIRNDSIIHLAKSLSFEEEHARHVARLALLLFDQTRKIHRMGSREREFLEAAAILHEVGLFISHSQHHHHSYYLIRNSELLGYTENEKEIIANIARYHRKAHPKTKHEGFNRLTSEDQRLVTKVASILRIADGLDRSHTSAVKSLAGRIGSGKLMIRLSPSDGQPLDMEIWGADRKKDLFEEIFKTAVKFVAR